MLLTFLNGSNATIGTSNTIGGFNSTSRNNISQLLFDWSTGFIPAGTRTVEATLDMTKTEGFYNDGYADNLSFIAASNAVPEPGTLLSSALALAALGLRGVRTGVAAK